MKPLEYSLIETEVKEHIFYLTLARPAKRNAFTPTMLSEIYHALNLASKNNQIWTIVIQAEGPVFCAGMDLAVFRDKNLEILNPAIELIDKPLGDILSEIHKPIIAVVNGPVLAGGMVFIAEATFVIATEKAVFSLPEVKRGLFPFQVMNSMTKILSMRKILELCILADDISAEQAKDLGLVTHLVDSNNLENNLQTLLKNIEKGSPLAIMKGLEMSKQLNSFPENAKNTILKSALDDLQTSKDAQEGIQAFLEKRTPKWENL